LTLLSIIVTSYTTERLKDIFELLDSILNQTYSDIETVFVVEGSKELYDKLRAYFENTGEFDSKVILIFSDTKLGLSDARNLGSKKAGGDILAFVDDDVNLFPGWAEAVVKTFEDDTIIGVTGPAFPLWKGGSLEWFPEEFHWLIGGTTWYNAKDLVDVRNGWGMNMSFRREAFLAVNGFRSSFGLHNVDRSHWRDQPSEDVDFSFRVRSRTGKRIVFNPSARVNHKISASKLTLKFVMQRAFSVGYQRRMIKGLYSESQKGDVLTMERSLLGRIFGRLFPSMLVDFFEKPRMTFHKALVVFVLMLFVGLGYCLTK